MVRIHPILRTYLFRIFLLLVSCGLGTATASQQPAVCEACQLTGTAPFGRTILDESVSSERGYDFSADQFTGLSGGDFYLAGSSFWANNLGQRGLVELGACESFADVTVPTSGYTRFGVAAIEGACYAALTQNDERDTILLRVDFIDGTRVGFDWVLVETGIAAVTLDSSISAQRGYDFSDDLFTDVTGGDFYFSGGSFWANNVGQRGVAGVGACASLDEVVIPEVGYTRFDVPAFEGECYVALTHDDERDFITFRVTQISGTAVHLDFRIVKTGIGVLTLDSSISAQRGYDFSDDLFTDVTGGDFYFFGGSFWANNVGQRGVAGVGACASLDEVVIPEVGYTRFDVPAFEGECYVALTHDDERDFITFRVTQISGTAVHLDFRIVKTGIGVLTLDSSISAQRGYDFSDDLFTDVTGGDFYFFGGSLWANNVGQRGVAGVGACASLDEVVIPEVGYTRFDVPAFEGECYVALTHDDERDFITFRVTQISGTAVHLDFRIVKTGIGVLTLDSSISAQRGYDFANNLFTGVSGGDFYFFGGSFWANNVSQRGVAGVGPCASLDDVTIPQTGYTRFDVPAIEGACYVALARRPLCDEIIFIVTGVSGTTVDLEFVPASVPEPRALLLGLCGVMLLGRLKHRSKRREE